MHIGRLCPASSRTLAIQAPIPTTGATLGERMPAKKSSTHRTVKAGPKAQAQPASDTQPISTALPMDPAGVREDYQRHLAISLGRDALSVNGRYRYTAMAMAVRDRLMERWKNTHAAYYQSDCKRGYYLSMEFLMGRAMGNALLNIDMDEAAREALHDLGMKLEDIQEEEADAGLGNGGLGRLAACFLDSCATLQLPVFGYGLRYEYGMFRQRVVNGQQVEEPERWLAHGSPWELQRPEYTQRVKFGGRSEYYNDEHGKSRLRWVGTHDVLAVPYDMPIPGYRNGTVNTLRLWRAEALEDFDLADFNQGDYQAAIDEGAAAENITRVLYPNDKSENGKELRLRQQYFLASASLQDIVRRWASVHGHDFRGFAEKNACQLNDTHPTVAVAELMRLLMDEYGQGWDDAWSITTRVFAYTNHTLLPEALEKWSVGLFRKLLPRPLEIIYEINARFMRTVANKWPGDTARQARMSIIEEGSNGGHVRMAYLAIVGSCSVNGVAALHTDLLKAGLFRDFCELWPSKFNNKTNGVTQRRWMALCNPGMSKLIDGAIGQGWRTELSELRKLAPKAKDKAFREAWIAVKRANKERLAEVVRRECGVEFPVDAMFDIQVKRIHEYKRQLLNALHVVHLYARIKAGDTKGWTKRCVLFGGKAAPGYHMAKSIIRFCCHLASVINADPDCKDLLRVAYLPDYRVSMMEKICPAADLSEQISTAGKEASGTGNMKFMMNGALTIGTLDGANIEIREEVGDEHFFLFGKTTEEIATMRAGYDPKQIVASDPDLKRVLDLIRSGHFNQCDPGIFDDIIHTLTDWGDYWMVCADFTDYVKAQSKAAALYQDRERWAVSSILNTASGKFSTDRTIGEYNRDIWKLPAVPALPV